MIGMEKFVRVDVLSDVKKPCGTVATDVTKFARAENKK